MTTKRASTQNRPPVLGRSPRFNTSISNNRLLLADESDAFIFDDPVYVAIASSISPGISWEKLCSQLQEIHPLSEIQAALMTFVAIGYARKINGSGVPSRDAWWEALGSNRSPRSVSVNALCVSGLDLIEEALKSCDIIISSKAETRLVLTDDYLRPELTEINRQAQPWILAKPTGYNLWLGPVFVPGQGPCWECLAWWLRLHRWKQWAFHGWRDDDYPAQPSVACLKATLATAAGMIATATTAFLTGNDATFRGTILTFDTRTLRQRRHEVHAIPGCPRCGGATSRAQKTLRSFVSNISGVVSELEVSSQPTAGMFHAMCSFVNALPETRSSEILRPGEAYGKGASADAAETACVAEALERHSYGWRGNEPIVYACLEDLDAIPPNAIGQYSESQFRERLTRNRDQNSMFWVPAPFKPSLRTGWVECRPIGSGKPRHVLAASVYFGYPCETDEPYFIPTSNGCAAGRTIEEGIANGLFELIERDGLAIWWYNRVRRPSVQPSALDDEDSSRIVRAIEREGRRVDILDVTTDVGIPTYVALATKPDGTDVVFGSAAHICPRRAAYKALSEVSQILYWKDRVTPNPELAEWLRIANTQSPDFEWLLPSGIIPPSPARRVDTIQAIAECVERLRDVGVEAYWIDLTRPEVGVPVVRTIAPGLRTPWARFAPGRLYDTPVRLGWQSTVSSEASLNPIHCMV